MASASFPSLHRCLSPSTSPLSFLLLPPTCSSNPTSPIPPQSFHSRNSIKHVATRRTRSGSGFWNSTPNPLVLPCDASIRKLASNVSLYNAIIQGMCLRGKYGAAKRLYTKMRDIGLVPDGKTRAMMLRHLTRDSP